MIKRSIQICLMISVVTALGFEYPAAPVTSYFDSSLWRERDVLEIASPTVLTEDTTIVVDELVLKAPLYANGHSLRIDAHQITVQGAGKIGSFADRAPDGAEQRQGAQGQASTSRRGRGQDAPAPFEGIPGVDGNQSPAAIVVFASKVEGELVVDGTGQTGGTGGKGGKGGKGGTGGPGEQAGEPKCWPWDSSPSRATSGGSGGQGSPGGRGGVGGRGGAPVPVIVTTADGSSNVRAISAPGTPGVGGAPGMPGDRGDGGPGGAGRARRCGGRWISWGASEPGAGGGPQGPFQTANLGRGPDGSPGPAVDLGRQPLPLFATRASQAAPGAVQFNFNSLEQARRQLVDTWTRFHFARSFYFLALDTLTLIQAEPTTSRSPLEAMIAEADRDRLEQLILLWKTQFLDVTADAGLAENTPLRSARSVAIRFVELLESKRTGTDGSHQQTEEAVRAAIGPIEVQLQASLNSAVRGCVGFLALKTRLLNEITALTGQYSVPVCQGTPDMTLPANLESRIVLFPQSTPEFPESLRGSVRRVASLESLFLRTLKALAPTANARDFVGSTAQNSAIPDDEFARRIPGRNGLQVSDVGAFVGFPEVARANSLNAVAQRVHSLAALLKGIQRP